MSNFSNTRKEMSAIVRIPNVLIPPYLRGKGPDAYLLREAYIITQLRDYINKREAKLCKTQALKIVKHNV